MRTVASCRPAPDRFDPVQVLTEQDKVRTPQLVPIRHERMLTSPFAFFRGSAAIMAADLAGTPVTGMRVQLCGDAHLSNFGGFAAPDRGLVFDLNDFDETLPGPWEWDIKRLAASVEVAGRDRGFGAGAVRDAVLATVRAAGRRQAVRRQRMIQAASDVLLGWFRIERDTDGRQRDYYVRQLWDAKASVPIDQLSASLASTGRSAAGRSRGPTPGPATAPRSRHIWGAATASTAQWPPSPGPTRSSTSASVRHRGQGRARRLDLALR
jgi:Uncharacterized protein conserved in bacteria (DUF2252)